MRVDFHPEAAAELEDSADWYGERSPSAAQNFAVAVDLAIAKICQDPDRFTWVDDVHQSCSVMKFPFQIVYRKDSDRITVIAVAHATRRSRFWRNR